MTIAGDHGRAAAIAGNIEDAVPLFGVENIDRSLRFYVDGLGFTVKDRWIGDGKLRWCWLACGGAALMLQEFWRAGHHANVSTTPLGVGVSVNFICKDALVVFRELTSRGVDAKRPFVGNGMWVTHVVDPDGYRLLFESPTDVIEETEYAG